MPAARSSLSGRLGGLLDRWASSFVLETQCADGGRLVIFLDPSWFGPQAFVVEEDDAPLDGVVVPDDLSGLLH